MMERILITHPTTVPVTVASAAKRREPEMAVDQKIIQDNINRIRCYIRAHRDFCIARTTLCRVDPHLDAVKNHTAHDDTEICYCAVMRLRR